VTQHVGWSRPEDLEAQLRLLWDRGQLLVAPGDGGCAFPLSLRLRRPDSRAMSDRFDEVRRWIRELETGSKTHRGFGYVIAWTEIEHRQLGRNRVPVGASVPTRTDALQLIGRQRQADEYERLAAATVVPFPQLSPWLAKRAMTALEHSGDWLKILAILAWFCEHPRPGVYLRQVDVAGVDSKFIETRAGLLMELLDRVLPPEAVDPAAGRHFEPRYGLMSKPPSVRFRILDRRHRIVGLSDLAVPAHELASLETGIRRVFVTENEINGLSFPEHPDALVIFGLGYGLERLAEVPWLREAELHYWGDIDTHGFAILDRLRASFPGAASMLMDHETLVQHRSLWGREETPHVAPLERLTPDERDVYRALVDHRHGEGVRLEQERIGFGWATRAIDAIG
jgi:hypothetical protein